MKHKKIAQALLRQREAKNRCKSIIIYALIVVLCAAIINIAYELHSPYYPIFEVFCGVPMILCLLLIFVQYRFPLLAEFIDWEKVEKTAQGENMP
jgi:hypothetical protein